MRSQLQELKKLTSQAQVTSRCTQMLQIDLIQNQARARPVRHLSPHSSIMKAQNAVTTMYNPSVVKATQRSHDGLFAQGECECRTT